MTEPPNAAAARSARTRWQIGLRTLLLLVCAVGAWLGVMMNRARTVELQARLKVLRPIARVLEVDDPGRIAVVKKLDQWMDEDRWDLYLPPGAYRICMATRQIGPAGLPPLMTSAPIPPGRHRLALDQRVETDSWKGVLTCDGSERLTLVEPKSFSGHGATTSDEISISQQFPASQPVVLYRRHFFDASSSGAPAAQSNGLMLWIEPAPAVAHGR